MISEHKPTAEEADEMVAAFLKFSTLPSRLLTETFIESCRLAFRDGGIGGLAATIKDRTLGMTNRESHWPFRAATLEERNT